MKEHFDQAVDFVLMKENGYVDDPDDPGKETKFGISKRSYPNEDIPGMTRERAIEIYYRDFWKASRCDDLPAQVAILVFDAAVNQGQPTAVKLLQEEVGVRMDGVIGPVTMAAIKRRNHDDLACCYAARRAVRYSTTLGREKKIRGWMLRLMDCYRLALVIG